MAIRIKFALRGLFRLLVTVLTVYIISQMLVFHSVSKSSTRRAQTSPELRRERQKRMSENGTVNIMDPPLLIPKLKKISELIQHADSDIVDLLGLPTSEKVFLTIGIRLNSTNPKDFKLARETIGSILKTTGIKDRRHYVIIFYLPFTKDRTRFLLQEALGRRYQDFVDDGLIQVIRPATDIYFDEYLYSSLRKANKLISLHSAKSNIDDAFLFLYSRGLSQFFIELRPGSTCATYFFKTMCMYVNSFKTKWDQIHFSENPQYGRLFRTDHLQTMAEDALHTYDRLTTEERLNIYKIYFQYPQKALFSYVETGESTNVSYYNRREVVQEMLKSKTINPAAKIFTDMRQYNDHELKYVYDRNPHTFFWSNGFQTGSYVTVFFLKPQLIQRIVVNTGSYINTDKLMSGILTTGQEFNMDTRECKNLTMQWAFIDGFVDTIDTDLLYNVSCLSIIVKSRQTDWLMLRNILVQVIKL
ncbi:alpha-1,3-mannosyl-glycoprotein 4-beta-N-acetylglucosaminyltransferase-like protein MGAT4E isoform X1 [Crassostrea angulata]|uniref:alpha-1,3-mannosyl-glycoprotein 4-beta-N-acetylglucosaminyltransferase-like protein MGAT4E isoform X1 n=2 Tax=Magallana angulata TaxID=2784310 RepID=UPI0022B1F17E|nr:alpha-1,3-mannosyl-glycoprotein 4-beta-N-acetylglucosaminyltransferase-like protein MGAT4E isoform X1 [Crassostrea angulata]